MPSELQENLTMAPQSRSPSKGQITVKVSNELIAIAEELAQLQGETVAEIYRQALKTGLSVLVEQDTKFRVHKKVLKGLSKPENEA